MSDTGKKIVYQDRVQNVWEESCDRERTAEGRTDKKRHVTEGKEYGNDRK